MTADGPALPPEQDWGSYAATLAEMVRSLLDPQQSDIAGVVRARAAALLARWDAGLPWAPDPWRPSGTPLADQPAGEGSAGL